MLCCNIVLAVMYTKVINSIPWCAAAPTLCLLNNTGAFSSGEREGGGDLVLTLPGCVCPKVKDMGPFLASRE